MSRSSTNRTNPLTKDQIGEFFSDHLPYRLSMLYSFKDIQWNDIAAKCHISNSTIYDLMICCCEASRISSRMFIQFMGLGINSNGELKEKRDYFLSSDKKSYEVKIIDLGGKWVSLNDLTDKENDLLAKTYETASKATAHLTYGDPHGGEPRILNDGSELILRLLKEYLYDIVGVDLKNKLL
ncbi:MAG TPA: hypothetical protein VIK55_15865 [Paludibacter sp.]